MCGRYASARKRQELLEEFQVRREHADPELPPDYNVAPTKPVYAVLTRTQHRDRPDGPGGPARPDRDGRSSPDGAPARQLRVLRWGLVPSWAKDPAIGSRLINARAETVAEKPSFRRAFARRRCLLPADGYYEWQEASLDEAAAAAAAASDGGAGVSSSPSSSSAAASVSAATSADAAAPAAQAAAAQPGEGQAEPGRRTRSGKRGARKVPYFIHPRGGGVLALAGLYELWRRPAGSAGPAGDAGDDRDSWLWTVTIITTSAADELGRIHDRMPMVIERSRWADWLDPARTRPDDVRELLVPAAASGLEVYPVSPAVNNVRNNGPGLIEPAQPGVISPGNGATGSAGPLF